VRAKDRYHTSLKEERVKIKTSLMKSYLQSRAQRMDSSFKSWWNSEDSVRRDAWIANARFTHGSLARTPLERRSNPSCFEKCLCDLKPTTKVMKSELKVRARMII